MSDVDINVLNKQVCILEDKVKVLSSDMKNRVTFATFSWVLGVLMVVVLGVLGIIYSKVESIDDKTEMTQHSVSEIKGILAGAEITQ